MYSVVKQNSKMTQNPVFSLNGFKVKTINQTST